MNRKFFIGDIHGCSKTFKKLITDKINILKSDEIFCVGDYIDRGGDSKGVVDFILELSEQNYKIHTLRGNHEQMLLDSARGLTAFSQWIMNGGDTTLKSFNVSGIHQLDRVYLDFFNRTRYFIQDKDFVAVHAGLNFKIQNPFSDEESMLWIRNFIVDKSFLDGKILIHGHTPMDERYITSQIFESPINIDGGCVYTDIAGLGNLFALDFNNQKMIRVKNIE
jgi:serine/threonine protein phosphatase 1